jgi:hypothetical protein
MTKKEVIFHLCDTVKMLSKYPTGIAPFACFCSQGVNDDYDFSDEAVIYIRQAVIEKIERDACSPKRSSVNEYAICRHNKTGAFLYFPRKSNVVQELLSRVNNNFTIVKWADTPQEAVQYIQEMEKTEADKKAKEQAPKGRNYVVYQWKASKDFGFFPVTDVDPCYIENIKEGRSGLLKFICWTETEEEACKVFSYLMGKEEEEKKKGQEEIQWAIKEIDSILASLYL